MKSFFCSLYLGLILFAGHAVANDLELYGSKTSVVVFDFDRTLDKGSGSNTINSDAKDFIRKYKNDAIFMIVSANKSRSTITSALDRAGIRSSFSRIYHNSGSKKDEFNDIASDYGLDDYRYFFMDDKDKNISSWKKSKLYSRSERNYRKVADGKNKGATKKDFNVVIKWLRKG